MCIILYVPRTVFFKCGATSNPLPNVWQKISSFLEWFSEFSLYFSLGETLKACEKIYKKSLKNEKSPFYSRIAWCNECTMVKFQMLWLKECFDLPLFCKKKQPKNHCRHCGLAMRNSIHHQIVPVPVNPGPYHAMVSSTVDLIAISSFG